MKTGFVLSTIIAIVLQNSISCAQEPSFLLRDKVAVGFEVNVSDTNGGCLYKYNISNGPTAKQSLWIIDLHASLSLIVKGLGRPPNWAKVMLKDSTLTLRWMADTKVGLDAFKDSIQPGSSRPGFSIISSGIPGFVTYYAEGWADLPSFSEGMATDDIPGYYDHTPYGPGVVGTVVGPIPPPTNFLYSSWIDTLISYKHQSVTLGWLTDNKTCKPDCDNIMNGRDWYMQGNFEQYDKWYPDNSWNFDHDWNNGIIEVLDARLNKAQSELSKKDSVDARQDLEIFVMEVELLNDVNEKLEGGGLKSEVGSQKSIMTSEAYALLKYNAEYLIDRLPEGRQRH